MSFSFLRRRSLFVLLLLFFFSLSLPCAFAQSPAGAGVGLSPSTIEGPANPGETQTHQLTVTNLSGSPQTYFLFVKDITGVKDGGVPIFADENSEKTGYELSSWVTLSDQQITLDPGQSKPVTVTINVPSDATPGSHFGGVFVSVNSPKLRESGASVGYQVANIISLRVAGDAVESATIRSFSTGNFIYTKPDIDFTARVENKGNVLVRPYGPLEIYNMFGKKVAMITFNDTQGGVFPKTVRDFKTTWTSNGTGFGRYQAILSLVYGEQGRQATISSTVTFWILPLNIILPALGVLAFLLLAAYISVRLYVRRTIRNMSGGTRRIVRRGRSGGMSALLLVTVVMLAVTALFLLALVALFA